MQIHQLVKDTMKKHRQKISLFQWAVISAVSSLVYSEYIARMKQKHVPTELIFVPTIRSVEELLDENGQFMELLSEKLIDRMVGRELFIKYKDAPELEIFNYENIEVTKTMFDIYIIPNISRSISETISKKFDLRNPDQKTFRENRDIDLFNRQPINDGQLNYIVDQTILQLLILLPTIKKDIYFVEHNIKIDLACQEIMTIDNNNAICPIHFTKDIIKNDDVIKLLLFVTSTSIEECDWQENALQKEGRGIVDYFVRTGVFNKVALTKLGDIVVE